MATVTGPTPPGTGEMAPATSATSVVSTSPTTWDLPSGPWMRLMPTSITVAPGLIHSGVTKPGTPAAEITTSHVRAKSGKSLVNRLTLKTVASDRINNNAIGFPTMLDWPTTRHRTPHKSTPRRSSM